MTVTQFTSGTGSDFLRIAWVKAGFGLRLISKNFMLPFIRLWTPRTLRTIGTLLFSAIRRSRPAKKRCPHFNLKTPASSLDLFLLIGICTRYSQCVLRRGRSQAGAWERNKPDKNRSLCLIHCEGYASFGFNHLNAQQRLQFGLV